MTLYEAMMKLAQRIEAEPDAYKRFLMSVHDRECRRCGCLARLHSPPLWERLAPAGACVVYLDAAAPPLGDST